MKKNYFFGLLLIVSFFSLNAQNSQTTVDCSNGPVDTTFCYDDNSIEEYTYVSNDGSFLNLSVISGNVENNWDEFVVLDSDGTPLYVGYGNQGDLSGLTFQSTGDTITVQVISDFIINCQSDQDINPINLQVSCATCTNPVVNFQLMDDCINAPQFFVEANVSSLGSATELSINDNQGNPAQTVTSTGVFSFGPYPNGTSVELTVSNNQDANCQIVSEEFSQDACTTNVVDCSVGPVNTVFCYDNSTLEEYTYVSSDGSVLNLIVNSGNIQEHFDDFIVLDTDGTVLYNGWGNLGDLSGLAFQSTGDTITVQVVAGFSSSCQDNPNLNPIDLTVSCATCANPIVDFELVDDCINAPQFFVEANILDLGSATDLSISDNQGNPPQVASSTGVFSFGPYPNGTDVQLSVNNNQDANCQIISEVFSQNACTTNLVDCSAGPVNTVFCYDNSTLEEYTYISNDGSVLNLIVNSGQVEEHFDEFIVIDSDGSILYSGYGNQGDLSGLSFQSSGDNITIQVDADFTISCQNNFGNTSFSPIDLQVSCATCINADVDFEIVDDCFNAPQFFIEADVTDLGSATDLTITDNQGNPAQTAFSTGIVTFGPYANGTIVQLTAENSQDPNCVIVSGVLTQDACTTNFVDCSAGPVNTVFCYDNSAIEEYTYVSSDGSVLNLNVNSGDVQEHFDNFIVLDTDGTVLYNGWGNLGDLSGLSFQSTGDTITVQVVSSFSTSCQDNPNIDPIDLTVSCATCVNPIIDFEIIDDCLNGAQFFVEAEVSDLGSATDLTITDNQGNPAQIASSTGIFSFGPYPNGTVVQLTAENNQDVNCQVVSENLTQEACTTNFVDCSTPVNTVFCYDNSSLEEYTYTSIDGSSLNMIVNSGNVEVFFDQFIVLDTDGSELYNGDGDSGDLTGLQFQSSGDTITVQVLSDFSINCQNSANINPIDLTVSCSLSNFVSGNVLYDKNNDGCSTIDVGLSNYMVNISDGTQDMSVSVDENGQYSAALGTGSYTLSVLNLDSNFISVPLTQTINFTGQNETIDNVDFCIVATQQFDDLAVDIMALEDAMPGAETDYAVIITNNGTQTVSNAQVSFNFNENLQSLVASSISPTGNTQNLMTFDLADIEPFSAQIISLTMQNADSSSLNEGDILSWTAHVTPDSNDANAEDNTTVFDQTVVTSYNPNNMMVMQGSEIHHQEAHQYLDYRIRFQNLGTTNAQHVRITDTIHDNLDWTTFHPVSSSHDYRVEIMDGEEINFYFDNIDLPDANTDHEGSIGYISYKIKAKSDIQIGDYVENNAHIHFDSNSPIETNTTVTTIIDNLSTNSFDFSQIKVYPNPVNDIFNLDIPSSLQVESIVLFDIQGRKLKTFDANNMLDISEIQQGVYILTVETNTGKFNTKLIKN